MEKTIEVNGRPVRFKCTGGTVRRYRARFHGDLIVGMTDLVAKIQRGEGFNADDLETFENIAFLMAKEGDPDSVPDDPDEWLDQFEMFSIYEIMPELIMLWNTTNTGIAAVTDNGKKN